MPGSSPPRKVTIEREFDGTIEEVWELWTTKAGLESWWGPKGFSTKFRRLEVRPGGEYEYEMTAVDPAMRAEMTKRGLPLTQEVRGRFTEVEPRERLATRNVVDFVPNTPAFEMGIEVGFHPSGRRTRMVLVMDVMPTEQWTRDAIAGHNSQFDRIDQLLAMRRRA